MNRTFVLAIGGVIALISACLIGLAVVAGRDDRFGPGLTPLEPHLGTAGVVAAGIGLASAAMLVGIGMGRWNQPKPVPTREGRRDEGLQQ